MRARANSSAPGFSVDPNAALLCSEGCGRPWASDFGRKLCSICARDGDRSRTRPIPLQAPTHAAAPHWQDAKDDDDQPLPF